MEKRIILATCGLPGAGKSVATDYLIEKGFYKIYFGDVTFDEMARLGLEVNEQNERATRERIRKENDGIGAYAKFIIPKIKKAFEEGHNKIVLESLYSWEEYTQIKGVYLNNFFIIGIHCPFKIRAERLKNRPKRPLTEEQTQSRDYAQIENLHQAGPIAYADFHIINMFNKENIYSEVNKILNQFSGDSE